MSTEGGIGDWMRDWHEGSVEKSARRAREEQAQQVSKQREDIYCTITAVVSEAEAEDVLRTPPPPWSRVHRVSQVRRHRRGARRRRVARRLDRRTAAGLLLLEEGAVFCAHCSKQQLAQEPAPAQETATGKLHLVTTLKAKTVG